MTAFSKAPASCTGQQLRDFHELVLAGRQVQALGLTTRIAAAQLLTFLYEGSRLIGTAAIKRASKRYRGEIFTKAGVAVMVRDYTLELGWIVVSPDYRGNKLSRILVAAALKSEPACLFATSRGDRIAMHKTLLTFAFQQVGIPFASVEEGTVLLFIRRGQR